MHTVGGPPAEPDLNGADAVRGATTSSPGSRFPGECFRRVGRDPQGIELDRFEWPDRRNGEVSGTPRPRGHLRLREGLRVPIPEKCLAPPRRP